MGHTIVLDPVRNASGCDANKSKIRAACLGGPRGHINARAQRSSGLTLRSNPRHSALAMAPTPRASGAQTPSVTPNAGSVDMPPPPPRTPAGAALPRRGVVRQPPAVTPDVATTPAPSPAATPAAPAGARPPTEAMPPPPALTSAPAPRGVKRPRASDATSGRKRPRAVTPRDRFVGSRLDDAGEAYRAHTALALKPRPGAQPVLNASLRSTLLPRRTGTRFLSFGADRAPAPEADGAAAERERTLALARATTSTTASRWRGLKSERILDAPELLDDFYCNLLDWSRNGGRIAIGLGKTVYVYSPAGTGSVDGALDHDLPVTSCAWAPGGNHVAVGDARGNLRVFDVETGTPIRALDGVHLARAGVLHWNPVTRCLTSGSRTAVIIDSDLRCPEAVNTWRLRHTQEVCGLRWRDDGLYLASGSNDNNLLLWDLRRADCPCHSMVHRAAIKAIAWCPTRRDFLASGAGTADRRVRIWNTITGASVASCSTGAQVTGLTWAPDGTSELVASLGFSTTAPQPPHGGFCALQWDRTGVGGLDVVARAKTHDGLPTSSGSRILNLAASPDRTRVVVTCPNETIQLYDFYDAPSEVYKSAFSTRRDVRRWDHVFGGRAGAVLR